MLARKLQFATILSVIGALVWLLYFWPRSTPIALMGFLVILFNFAPMLAVQFLTAWQLNKRHPEAPLAGRTELLRAWWDETWAVPLVFCWRQAFRSNQIPDDVGQKASTSPHSNRRGVVFVHGFISNRGMWMPWLAQLQKQKRAFAAVTLEPLFCSIDDYPAIIEQAVQKVTQSTGLPPLLVCHSMGGLAARAWLQSADGNDARVHHVITVGTPHHGTWIGLNRVPPNMKQMRIGSDWLSQLASKEPPERYQRFTCFYSNCDNIVFPTMTATLPGADNRHVPGEAHVVMLFNQSVIDMSLAKL